MMSHRRLSALLVAGLLFGLAAPVGATGRLLVADGEARRPLECAWLHVDVQIDERLSRTTLTQVFVNNTDSELEGVYEFPLPRDAAVSGFAVWHGGERSEAEIDEKDRARKDYDRAADEGRAPALLSSDSAGRFRMDVFAIPAGGTKRVELVYTELLDYSAGVVSYVFPAAHREKTARGAGLFDVDVTLAAPADLSFVGSPSWPEARVTRDGVRTARLALTVGNDERTRDVDVVFGVETTPFGFRARAHRPDSEEPGVFQLGFAFNRDDAPADRAPRDIVFAVDTSLSMAGTPLRRARRVVTEALGELDEKDRVNVVAFDAVVQSLFEAGQPANAKNVGLSTDFAARLRAHRGSDLGAFLSHLPELYTGEGRPTLVLLTDGQPTLGETDDEALAALGKVAAETRPDTIVVHLGYPSRRIGLEAALPGADYRYVPDGVAGDAAVEEIVHALTAPALRDVSVRVDGAEVYDVHPAEARTLLAGRQLLVRGRYLPPADGSPVRVTVAGSLHGHARRFTYEVPFPARTGDEDAAIAREWAKEHVRSLLAEIAVAEDTPSREALVDTVKTLGRNYRLVTPYTSFLARRPVSLSLERFKPGDPEIYIDAPASLARVVAILPWGETIPCRFLPRKGQWMGRFLVPRGTPDGLYRIRVILVAQSGAREERAVLYRVDATAPKMRLVVPEHVRPGERIWVRALPVEHVFEGKGTRIRADVRRVVVHIGGARRPLRLEADGSAWAASLRILQDLPPGDAVFRLVVSDWAANSSVVEHETRVLGPPDEER